MSEKEKKYPKLILKDDGSYKIYEKEWVEIKFKKQEIFEEFISNPELQIEVIFNYEQ